MIDRHSSELECVKQARRSLRLIRQRLLNPTPKVMEMCVPHFNVAIDCLAQLQGLLRSETSIIFGRGTLRAEIVELRAELAQVRALMNNAAVFYQGLGQLMGGGEEDMAGYTAAGLLATSTPARLQLEG
jgi:hypothetical protein